MRTRCHATVLTLPVLLFALFLALVGLAPAVPAQTLDARAATAAPETRVPAREAPRYKLQAGDRIQITVFGHEELSGNFAIDDGGSIAFPLLGRVRLDGLTLYQAEGLLIHALKPDYLVDPRVGIQIREHRPIYILGEVANPGSYPYRQGLTVTEAVALAGGFTFRANEDALRIKRASDPARRGQTATPATRVLPGDTVRVDAGLF